MQEVLDFFSINLADVKNMVNLFRYTFTIFAVGLLIEYFNPAERDQPSENIRFNIVYAINFIVVNTILLSFMLKFKAPVVDFFGGSYFTLSFDTSISSQVLHVLSFLFIFDFFYYWLHRWQHKFKLLWAQHQFHHSEKSLNVTTGNRHHWLEETIRVFVILIPMSILFDFKAQAVGAIWSAFMLWGYFIHLNIKLDLAWLTPIFCGPQLHRIHHSNLKPHLDKNFAAFFPIYDIIFRTYFRPAKDEYPTTGLYGGFDMNSLKQANLYPFVYWYKRIKKLFIRS